MGERMSGRAANDHCGTGLSGPKGERHMTNRRKSALLMVSLAVVAGVSAPAADALPSCQDSGTTSTCQTNGSVSQDSSRDSGGPREPACDSVGAPPLVPTLNEWPRVPHAGTLRVRFRAALSSC